jgi:hypothetical protein
MIRRRVKQLRRSALAVAVLGLVGAAGAGAYVLPLPPGSPGGPATAPGGPHHTRATNAGAVALADTIAGYTAAELVNIQTFTLTVQFPRAGTVYGRLGIVGVGEIGEGFAGRANRGTQPMSVSFSATGRAYLTQHNGQAVVIQVKYAFQPNRGRTKYSTTTVTTDN